MQPVCQNVHINHSATIRQPRTRSHRLPGPESGQRGCTQSEPPSPVLSHTQKAEPAWQQAAAAVGATHRPDVAVRSRPQLARSVLLRIHPPPAGGRDSYYISHAPTRQINNNKQPRARQHTPPVIDFSFFYPVCVFNAPIYPCLASARHPAIHPPTRPATITDQRRDVTMRRWIIFRYKKNRSAR